MGHRSIPLIALSDLRVSSQVKKNQDDLPASPTGISKKPLKVAIILDTIPVGGPGKGVVQFVRSLSESNSATDVTIYNFAYQNRGRQYFNELAQSHGLQLRTIEQSGRLDWRFVKALCQEFYEDGVQIVQTHSFKPHVVGWRLRRLIGIPWLAFAHGWTAQSKRVHAYNAIEKRLVPKSDYCCTVTADLRDELMSYGCDGEKIEIVPNAVDVPDSNDLPSSANAREALGLRTDALILSCIGRFSREKGQDILLDAIHAACLRHLDYQLVFAGDGPEEGQAKRWVRDKDLSDRVVFLGHLDDVSLVYSATDLLVVPSRSEGVPNVVLEAFSRSIPVVATPVGALPEMITESGAGWLAEDVSSNSLSQAIDHATSNLSTFNSVGQRGLAYAKASFNPDSRRQQILEIYNRLVPVVGSVTGDV